MRVRTVCSRVPNYSRESRCPTSRESVLRVAGTTIGYWPGTTIKVNNKLLASNDAVDQKAGESQQTAQFKIADLGLKITPLKSEVDDLKALDEAKLATEEDLTKLAALEEKLKPLQDELQQLNGQIAARYPWFQEAAFTPTWLDKGSANSVKITLLTCTHAGADTRNYVYFRTGGKKYLLDSYDAPLAGSMGPQTFELDLLSGPLSAAGMRGFAIGMLAHGYPYGKAPDRWHPQRLRVEVDNSVVYDSEEYPYDCKSLAAIRLIPPAHLDDQGEVVSNSDHTLREVFVWESGKGQGLDQADGSPLPLPPKEDPGYPEAEPGLPDDSIPDDTAPDDGSPSDDGFPSDDDFPGEDDWCPPGDGGWDGGVAPWPPGGGWLPWPPGGGIWPWPPGGANPPPAGQPPQVTNVRFTSGWKTNHTFGVEWDVTGDESLVNQYRITLFSFQPELANPATVQLDTKTVPVGGRSTTVAAAGPLANVDYFVALVAAELNDGTVHAEWSPVRAVFPPATDPIAHQLQIFPLMFRYQPQGPGFPPWLTGPLSLGSEPGGPRAVWSFGREQSHIDFEFDDPFPGPAWNIAMRPNPHDARMEVQMTTAILALPGGTNKFKFVTYVGFAKGKGAWNTADFDAVSVLTKVGGLAFMSVMAPQTVTHPLGGVPQPMKKIEIPFDLTAPGMGPGLYTLRMSIRAKGGELDPDHPPTFFGARFIPD